MALLIAQWCTLDTFFNFSSSVITRTCIVLTGCWMQPERFFEHVSHLIMSLDGRWVASISILNHGVVSTAQQLGWTALILHHTLSCEQSVCNVAADWILMRRCYFVIPTACVRLKSEATPVQHNAFQKRFDLCSSVKHTWFFFFYFSLWLWTPSVFSVSCVFWLLSAAVQLDSVSQGRGGGWWCFLVAGVRGLDPSSVVCWCVWLLPCRVFTALVQARAQTCTNSNSRKDANLCAYSLIILSPSCEEGLLIWSYATWKISPSQHTVLKQRHPRSSCSQLQRVWKELPV